MKSPIYYKINSERIEYLGKRYFRWHPFTGEVCQVYFGGGEPRKGRNAMVGIYYISSQTFFSNYLAMSYAVPCTKKEWTNACVKVLSVLLVDKPKSK